MDTISSADASTVTNEDIVRMSAQIAALADPTGIAGTISAYTYSKCSALKLWSFIWLTFVNIVINVDWLVCLNIVNLIQATLQTAIFRLKGTFISFF